MEGGGAENVAYYRPVSLAVVVCKIIEQILKRVISLVNAMQWQAASSVLPFQFSLTRRNAHSVDGRW